MSSFPPFPPFPCQDPHGQCWQRRTVNDAGSCQAVRSHGRECFAEAGQSFENVVIQCPVRGMVPCQFV